jgi:DNA-binding MarR family transcriptional regulator
MADLELLEAVDMHDVRTPAHVAAQLHISEADAMSQLRDAEQAGLVGVEEDESLNVPADFQRLFLYLTDDGRAEMYRLQDEQAGR